MHKEYAGGDVAGDESEGRSWTAVGVVLRRKDDEVTTGDKGDGLMR